MKKKNVKNKGGLGLFFFFFLSFCFFKPNYDYYDYLSTVALPLIFPFFISPVASLGLPRLESLNNYIFLASVQLMAKQ